MDISEKNSLNNVNGIIVSEINYLNKGKIYKVITEKFGYIDVFSKNLKNNLSIFSKYSFNLRDGQNMFYYVDSDLLKYNDFSSKNIILSFNFISEIICKSMYQGMDIPEIYSLLENVIENINSENYIFLLNKFVIIYLKYNGYYFSDSKKYNDYDKLIVNINKFEMKHYGIESVLGKFDFVMSGKSINYILDLTEENCDYNLEDIKDLSRVFGIMTNALCLNLEIKEIKSFKFLIK